MGGTLIISRNIKCHGWIQQEFEKLGFANVEVTGEERDSLNMVINDKKPDLVFVGSAFYQAGTPQMMGEVLRLFPHLNIAAVSVYEYPDSTAAWFIFNGVKSYVNWYEGPQEFYAGMERIRSGKGYIAPQVRALIDTLPEWPKTNNAITRRLLAIVILVCNGRSAEEIGRELHITLKTVYNHLNRLYKALNVNGREEMIAKAWELHLVTPKDMCFLSRSTKLIALPEWAEAQIRMNTKSR